MFQAPGAWGALDSSDTLNNIPQQLTGGAPLTFQPHPDLPGTRLYVLHLPEAAGRQPAAPSRTLVTTLLQPLLRCYAGGASEPSLSARFSGERGREVQGCARKCVATCIRGGGVFRLLGLCLLTLAWGSERVSRTAWLIMGRQHLHPVFFHSIEFRVVT